MHGLRSLLSSGSSVAHTVSVGKLQSWLDGGAKSPNEQVVKSRLREMS